VSTTSDEDITQGAKDALKDQAFWVKEPRLYLETVEMVRLPLLELRCRLQKELFNERDRMRHPKDKELTDLDRTIMLNAMTSELNEKYELARGLEELVKERVAIIKTLLETK
jgi:hypothetical protein